MTGVQTCALPISLNAAVLGSERTLTSSSNATYGDVREAYDLICSGKVNVRPMITHRLALSEYARGFDLLLRSPKEAFKVVLCPQSAGNEGEGRLERRRTGVWGGCRWP